MVFCILVFQINFEQFRGHWQQCCGCHWRTIIQQYCRWTEYNSQYGFDLNEILQLTISNEFHAFPRSEAKWPCISCLWKFWILRIWSLNYWQKNSETPQENMCLKNSLKMLYFNRFPLQEWSTRIMPLFLSNATTKKHQANCTDLMPVYKMRFLRSTTYMSFIFILKIISFSAFFRCCCYFPMQLANRFCRMTQLFYLSEWC